jgi:ABC-type cobalt transport system substrate-binding protein
MLLLLLQEWHIIGINTTTWRSRVLAPMTEPRSGPLDSIMMAITGVGAKVTCYNVSYGIVVTYEQQVCVS